MHVTLIIVSMLVLAFSSKQHCASQSGWSSEFQTSSVSADCLVFTSSGQNLCSNTIETVCFFFPLFAPKDTVFCLL